MEFFNVFNRRARLAAVIAFAIFGATACGGGSTVLSEPVPPSKNILFIGNSFTIGDGSPEVANYKTSTIKDLNGLNMGGVASIFKAFTIQAGLNYTVSIEAGGGTDLKFHYENKAALIQRAWDVVVMQDYSTLSKENPGNSTKLITYSGKLATMFYENNPSVIVKLSATWSRADQTYLLTGHWYGQPIEKMALDLMAAYRDADQQSTVISGVIPIGLAWNTAFKNGFADSNPYDGIDAGRVNLWATDNYHASKFGYYLEALTIFASVTGRDPRILGSAETVAADLGITPTQAQRMQQIAYEQLH